MTHNVQDILVIGIPVIVWIAAIIVGAWVAFFAIKRMNIDPKSFMRDYTIVAIWTGVATLIIVTYGIIIPFQIGSVSFFCVGNVAAM